MRLGLLIIPVALLFACAKKQEESPPSASPTVKKDWQPPDNPLQRLVTEFPSEVNDRAVRASSGPIEISLELYSTRVSLDEPVGFRIALKNVGPKLLLVNDPTFLNVWDMVGHSIIHHGIYIEAEEPGGGELLSRGQMFYGPDLSVVEREEPPDPAELAKVKAMGDQWKKEGLTLEQINKKLYEYSMSQPPPRPPTAVVLPGKSLVTKPWFYKHELRKQDNWQPPWRDKPFAELTMFWLDQPGKYRFRAVYDHSPLEALKRLELESNPSVGAADKSLKKHKEFWSRRLAEAEPSDVTCRTPWIEVTVTP